MIAKTVKTGFPAALPYLSALYYANLLFFLPKAVFVAGKPAAVAATVILSCLWTLHVIGLYCKKERNRKIHLAVLWADTGLRLPLALSFLFTGAESAMWYDVCFFALNCVTLVTAGVSMYFLTDETVRACYG